MIGTSRTETKRVPRTIVPAGIHNLPLATLRTGPLPLATSMHTGRLAAANIRKPLLIAQGANDPRVKQAESDQMVAALRAGGIPVTYVLFADEGHGFARPENAIACNALIEDFLARHLGGEAEPISAEQMAVSTAKIIESS